MRLIASLLLPLLVADVSPRGPFDPQRLRLELAIAGGDDFVFAAAPSPDGRLLAAGRRDGGVQLWEGSGTRRIQAHEGCVYAVRFSRDAALLASAGADRGVRLWEVRTGGLVRSFIGHAGPVQAVAFSPDSRLLVSGGSDAARVWNLSDDREPARVLQHGAPVFAVAVSEGRIATAGSDGIVRLWSLAGDEPLHALKGGPAPVAAVAFSPDGRRVAAAGFDGKLRVWSVGSAKLLFEVDAHSGIASAVAFSPEGRLVASGGHDGVKFWDRRGRLRGTLAPGAPAYGVAFVGTGSRIVATFGDNRVRAWGTTGRPLAEPAAEREPGFLGVSYDDQDGALVTSIVADSQAERVGLQAGDLIIGVDATPVTQSSDFFKFMRGTFEGDEVTVRIRRDGKEQFIRAKLGRRP